MNAKDATAIPTAAVDRLVELIRGHVEWERQRRPTVSGPTATKKRYERFHANIEKVRAALVQEPLVEEEPLDLDIVDVDCLDIVDLDHDGRRYERDERGRYVGERPGHRDIKQIAADLADVQQSIALYMDSLPHPKEKKALKFAAVGVLHLHHVYGVCDNVKLWNNSPAVQLLKTVCERAGLHLSDERYRGMLTDVWEDWRCGGSSHLKFMFELQGNFPLQIRETNQPI